MSRWLYVTLCLALFLLAMSGVGWIINATVPPAVHWLGERVGYGSILVVVFPLAVGGMAWGYLANRAAERGTRSRARSP